MLKAISVVKRIAGADLRTREQVLIDTLRGPERLDGSWDAVRIFIQH